jgi:hypothetical protein
MGEFEDLLCRRQCFVLGTVSDNADGPARCNTVIGLDREGLIASSI